MRKFKNKTDEERYKKAKSIYDAFIKWYPFSVEDLDGEVWRDVSGCEGLYKVSNYSRVMSLLNGTKKILKPSLSEKGYLTVRLYANGKRRCFRVSRLVAQAFIPNPENKPEVDHINGDKLNCCANNLRWCTHKENVNYAWELGLMKVNIGTQHHNSKLNDLQVQAVFALAETNKFTSKQLGEIFGISKVSINKLRKGITYRNCQPAKVTAVVPADNPAQLIWSDTIVITTKQLAEFYGCTTDNIKKNFQRNADNFVEGKHYFKLEGAALKEFKNKVSESPLVEPNAKVLYLWTRRGAARHAKMLTTEKAWQVFETLEETYFRIEELLRY